MKKIQQISSSAPYSADLLIVLDGEFERELDELLGGAISYNKRQLVEPFVMTTNGKYPVPRIGYGIYAAETVAVWVGEGQKAFEKLLFEIEASTIVVISDQDQSGIIQLFEAREFAKELIESPSNLMTPAIFAEKCRELEKLGATVTILDEVDLKEEGACALLAVGRGSVNPPRLAVIEWKGADEDPIVVVGKGICFDAGGIQLKTAHLLEMKWDKAGGGAVVGALHALAAGKVPAYVVGIIPLAENIPDGAALRPADVIRTLSGKTVEIVDTDNEGRLVLADALTYAQKYYRPRILIDLGTLTLEVFGALGKEYAGLFCTDRSLAQQLISAGEKVGERLWELPLGESYARQLMSRVADLKNSGIQGYGESSAAAEFLRAFVSPSIPWAHIDIAGVAWDLQAPERGVSAFGVRLLTLFISEAVEAIAAQRGTELE